MLVNSFILKGFPQSLDFVNRCCILLGQLFSPVTIVSRLKRSTFVSLGRLLFSCRTLKTFRRRTQRPGWLFFRDFERRCIDLGCLNIRCTSIRLCLVGSKVQVNLVTAAHWFWSTRLLWVLRKRCKKSYHRDIWFCGDQGFSAVSPFDPALLLSPTSRTHPLMGNMSCVWTRWCGRVRPLPNLKCGSSYVPGVVRQ